MPRAALRVVLIGWGAINTTVARELRALPVEIVAIGVRDRSAPLDELPEGAKVIDAPEALAATEPDLVIEAAGRESVAAWGPATLECGADLIVSSTSAFADTSLLDLLTSLASRHGAHVHVQPGALAGVDALAAAGHLGIAAVEHRIVKPPHAWRGTPAEDLCDLSTIAEPVAFFSATADETAVSFPKNANVAMTVALAGIGPSRTTVTLVADPHATSNRHELRAHGDFGSLEVTMANMALPGNPKTSALAALGLVRIVRNRVSPLVV